MYQQQLQDHHINTTTNLISYRFFDPLKNLHLMEVLHKLLFDQPDLNPHTLCIKFEDKFPTKIV